MKKKKEQQHEHQKIDDNTRSIGRGPVTIDVLMCRRHGWSTRRIQALAEAVDAVVRGRLRGWK